MPGLSDLPDKRRLDHLELTMSEEKRAHADTIQVFKMLEGYEDTDSYKFLKAGARGTYIQGKTRGHNLKLLKHKRHQTTK